MLDGNGWLSHNETSGLEQLLNMHSALASLSSSTEKKWQLGQTRNKDFRSS